MTSILRTRHKTIIVNAAVAEIRKLEKIEGTGVTYVTVPMKRDLNAGIFESVFIVESDRASFKLQNDTKIDLLATFFPEICLRERYEGIE